MKITTILATSLAMVATLALIPDAAARKPTRRVRACPVNRTLNFRQQCRCPSGTKLVVKSRSTRVCERQAGVIASPRAMVTDGASSNARPGLLRPGTIRPGIEAVRPGTGDLRPGTNRRDTGRIRPRASRTTGFDFIDELLRSGKTNIWVGQPITLQALLKKLLEEAQKLQEGPCGPQMAALMAIINELVAKYGAGGRQFLMMGSRGQTDGGF